MEVPMDGETGGKVLESKNVTDANGNSFEVYTKTYTHNYYDDQFNEGSTKNVTMMFNPANGASLVGNPHDGYNLYVEDQSGNIRQYAVNDSVGSIEDYAYLLNSDFMNSSESNGILGTKSVSAYGPNGELVSMDAGQVYGQKQKVTIDGKEVEICTTNAERDNLLSELSSGSYSKVASTQDTTQNNSTLGGNSRSYGGGSGQFERGLRGDVDENSPWINVEYAEALRRFVELTQFSASDGYDFSTFIERIQWVIETIQKQGCFFTNPLTNAPQPTGGQQKTNLEEAITQVGEYQRTKESIMCDQFRQDIVTYNDNVEKAKVQNTRKALREACEQYNNEKHVAYYNYSYTYDENGNIAERIEEPVYDKINYDAFFTCFDTFLDMKNDQMVRELEARGITVNLEGRPEWTM